MTEVTEAAICMWVTRLWVGFMRVYRGAPEKNAHKLGQMGQIPSDREFNWMEVALNG